MTEQRQAEIIIELVGFMFHYGAYTHQHTPWNPACLAHAARPTALVFMVVRRILRVRGCVLVRTGRRVVQEELEHPGRGREPQSLAQRPVQRAVLRPRRHRSTMHAMHASMAGQVDADSGPAELTGAQAQHAVLVDGRFDDWAAIEPVELQGTHAQQFSKIALEPRAGTPPPPPHLLSPNTAYARPSAVSCARSCV